MRPDEADAALQLRVAAFSTAMQVPSDDTPSDDYVPDDHRLVAIRDGRVVGHAAVWPFHQAIRGRIVPMGGLAGVAVAVDRRGHGIGSALLEAALDLMDERGMAVSSLYPSIPVPYRRWGWEVAGEHVRRRIATRDLLDLPPGPDDVRLRLFEPADLDAATAFHDGITATEPGGLVGGRRWLARALSDDPDEPEIAIVATRDGRLVGLSLATKTAPEDDGHSAYGLRVLRLLGEDRGVERVLWRNIGLHHPVAATTTFNSQPAEPLLFDLPLGLHLPQPTSHHWMTRLVDAPAAMAARGWPTHADARVELGITDRRRQRNDGPHVLEVLDGEGRLVPGGSGRIRLDIGTLSSIWTGFTTPSAMARHDRIDGAGPADLALLDDLFSAPAPFLRDYF